MLLKEGNPHFPLKKKKEKRCQPPLKYICVFRLVPFSLFKEAFSFSNGFAGVLIGDRWGFINKEGIPVIKPQWSPVSIKFEFDAVLEFLKIS